MQLWIIATALTRLSTSAYFCHMIVVIGHIGIDAPSTARGVTIVDALAIRRDRFELVGWLALSRARGSSRGVLMHVAVLDRILVSTTYLVSVALVKIHAGNIIRIQTKETRIGIDHVARIATWRHTIEIAVLNCL